MHVRTPGLPHTTRSSNLHGRLGPASFRMSPPASGSIRGCAQKMVNFVADALLSGAARRVLRSMHQKLSAPERPDRFSVLTGAAVLRHSVWRNGKLGARNQSELIREDPNAACATPELRWAIRILDGHAAGRRVTHFHNKR